MASSRPRDVIRSRSSCTRAGQRRGLKPGVGGERVVLERVVFRQDVQPVRLLEVGHGAEEADPPRQPGGGSHADHRRQQHELRRQRATIALDRLERVLQRQRTAVGIADENERRPLRNPAAHVSHAHPHRGEPVVPGRPDQARGKHAVPGHAQRQRVDAAGAQDLGNGPHAVRRVAQAVNEQRAAANDRRFGLEGSIPVAAGARGMRQAASMIAVDRRAVRGIDRRLEFAELRKQLLFAGQILRKGEVIVERRRADVVEADAMPWLEIGMPPACIVARRRRSTWSNARAIAKLARRTQRQSEVIATTRTPRSRRRLWAARWRSRRDSSGTRCRSSTGR